MKLSRIFLLIRLILLIFVLILSSNLILGCVVTPSPSPTPTPISYLVHVINRKTADNISGAEVKIEVGGIAPLDAITDSSGVARIQILPTYSRRPGFLIVTAQGYETHTENIDIIIDRLPDVIKLAPLGASTETPTSVSMETPIPTSVSMETPIPVSQENPISFYYQVQVEVKNDHGNGKSLQGVKVIIQVGGQAVLDDITDVNGIARILIPSTHVGQPSVLLVELDGYKKYRQHIDLVQGGLLDIIQLEYSEGTDGEVGETVTAISARETITVATATAMANQTVTTITMIPTSTPIPIPQVSFTPPTPTNIPIPPDAIVTAAEVVLYDGPAFPNNDNSYKEIVALTKGTHLKILRCVQNNRDWLKVSVDSTPKEYYEGYVNIALDAVKINVNLDNIKPIYEYGPALYEPKYWSSYPVGEENKEFQWEEKALEPNQYYSVRVVMDIVPEPEACVHIQTKEAKAFLKLDCPPGSYYWSAIIATKLSDSSDIEWREDSERNGRIFFGIGQPHQNEPPNSGNNGGGGGNTGSWDPP